MTVVVAELAGGALVLVVTAGLLAVALVGLGLWATRARPDEERGIGHLRAPRSGPPPPL